jgi:hypothetical protein
VLLSKHGEQPAEGAADRRGRRDVGVHGVAGLQQPGGFTAEEFLAHAGDGQGQEP